MSQMSAMVNAAAAIDARKIMKICSRHGKKRQAMYLVEGEVPGEWVCREEDQCKMSQGGKKGQQKLEEPVVADDASEDTTNLVMTPCSKQPELARQWSLGDLSAPSITSWADEVDQEFPEGLSLPGDFRSDFMHQPYNSQVPQWTMYTHTQSCPQIRRPTSLMVKPKKLPATRLTPQFNEADLLHRIEQLQDELSTTKRELKRAKEEMKAVVKNERLLETIVQELHAEVAEIQKKQQQLEIIVQEDHLRKAALAPKLNPDATPFVPVTRCCGSPNSKGPGDNLRKEDLYRNVDSARSNMTNNSNADSYDSDNFGMTHEDGQEDSHTSVSETNENDEFSPRDTQSAGTFQGQLSEGIECN